MMFVVAGLAILTTMGMALARMFAGPTLYDRILATNVFGTKTVLMIAVIGFIVGRPEFIDVAIVYALINFIGIVAVLKFFEYGSFGGGSRKGTDTGALNPDPSPSSPRPSHPSPPNADSSTSGPATPGTPRPSRSGKGAS